MRKVGEVEDDDEDEDEEAKFRGPDGRTVEKEEED